MMSPIENNTSNDEEESKEKTGCANQVSLFWYKAFYLFFIGAFWMKIVYLPLYFKQIGLPAHYAGVLAGISPFLRGAGSFSLGLLAEKPETRKVMLLMSLIAQILTPLLCLIPHPSNALHGNLTHTSTIVNHNKTAAFFPSQEDSPAEDYLETIQKCIKGNLLNNNNNNSCSANAHAHTSRYEYS